MLSHNIIQPNTTLLTRALQYAYRKQVALCKHIGIACVQGKRCMVSFNTTRDHQAHSTELETYVAWGGRWPWWPCCWPQLIVTGCFNNRFPPSPALWHDPFPTMSHLSFDSESLTLPLLPLPQNLSVQDLRKLHARGDDVAWGRNHHSWRTTLLPLQSTYRYFLSKQLYGAAYNTKDALKPYQPYVLSWCLWQSLTMCRKALVQLHMTSYSWPVHATR